MTSSGPAGPAAPTPGAWEPFDRRLLAGEPQRAAVALLGAGLVAPGGLFRITEVEAYGGSDDLASHAFRGRTARNGVMFGPAGFAYVYRSYGIHWCLNVVTGTDGTPAAVLIRGAELVPGAGTGVEAADRRRARGPGRLTVAAGITGDDDGIDLCPPGRLLPAGGRLRLVRLEPPAGVGVVRSGPRVGITVAAGVPWRFWLDGEPSVSAYRAGTPRRRPPAPPPPPGTVGRQAGG